MRARGLDEKEWGEETKGRVWLRAATDVDGVRAPALDYFLFRGDM